MISKNFSVYKLASEILSWESETDWHDAKDSPGMVADAISDHPAVTKAANGYFVGSTAEGLAGYLAFDGDVTDETPLANDGTDNTSAGYVTGQVGSDAKDFDGTDDTVEIDWAVPYTTDPPWTVACWFNADAIADNELVWDYGTTRAYVGYQRNGTNGYEFAIYNGSSHSVVTSGNTTTGAWLHAVAVYTGSEMEFFIGGTSQGTAAESTQDTADQTAAIGAVGSSGNRNNFFNGAVDDFRVYGRALSKPEIDALYARTTTQPVNEADTL